MGNLLTIGITLAIIIGIIIIVRIIKVVSINKNSSTYTDNYKPSYSNESLYSKAKNSLKNLACCLKFGGGG